MSCPFFAQIGIPIYVNTKFTRDIGEGMSVKEIGYQRVFYSGQGNIFYFDNNSDGILDRKYENIPISPFMGGPGYRLFEKPILEEDRERFERANILLHLSNVQK